jgi:hypothetical protein
MLIFEKNHSPPNPLNFSKFNRIFKPCLKNVRKEEREKRLKNVSPPPSVRESGAGRRAPNRTHTGSPFHLPTPFPSCFFSYAADCDRASITHTAASPSPSHHSPAAAAARLAPVPPTSGTPRSAMWLEHARPDRQAPLEVRRRLAHLAGLRRQL